MVAHLSASLKDSASGDFECFAGLRALRCSARLKRFGGEDTQNPLQWTAARKLAALRFAICTELELQQHPDERKPREDSHWPVFSGALRAILPHSGTPRRHAACDDTSESLKLVGSGLAPAWKLRWRAEATVFR